MLLEAKQKKLDHCTDICTETETELYEASDKIEVHTVHVYIIVRMCIHTVYTFVCLHNIVYILLYPFCFGM